MTLNAMSGGRFILGVGPSGPQVIEGLARCPLRQAADAHPRIHRHHPQGNSGARRPAGMHDGEHYQIPYTGPGSTGLAQAAAARSCTADPQHQDLLRQLLAQGCGERGAAVADGIFPIFMAPEKFDLFGAPLEKGFAKVPKARALANLRHAALRRVRDGRRPGRLPPADQGAHGASTSAAWARAIRTSTTTTARSSATRLLRWRSRTSSSAATAQAPSAAAVPDALVDEVALVGPQGADPASVSGDWKYAAARSARSTPCCCAAPPAVDAIRLIAEEVL